MVRIFVIEIGSVSVITVRPAPIIPTLEKPRVYVIVSPTFKIEGVPLLVMAKSAVGWSPMTHVPSMLSTCCRVIVSLVAVLPPHVQSTPVPL